MAYAPSEDSDQDAEADLSLCWAHSHFVGARLGSSIGNMFTWHARGPDYNNNNNNDFIL